MKTIRFTTNSGKVMGAEIIRENNKTIVVKLFRSDSPNRKELTLRKEKNHVTIYEEGIVFLGEKK